MTRPHESVEILAGRYRLGQELGSGAHGTVYVAEDLGRGGERVALKVTQSSHEGLAFFSPAAQTLHWFRHPHWAEVFDAGVVPLRVARTGPAASKPKTTHCWFQAMRLVEGRSLEDLDGPQDVDFVCRFLESGARVLQAMHERGLIHYDVTPSNFLLEESKQGHRFVLTDGGLAHIGPVAGAARGTPLFMAPELTEEGTHDHRVDLYALGLIAFRLATGKDPIPAGEGDVHEVMSRVLGQRRRDRAPRASGYRPDLPKALDDLIAALLARDPEERPADGRAVLLRLSELLEDARVEVRRSEAFARAESGLLVDRKGLLQRFADSCRVLARHVPSADGRTAQAPEIHPDTVLILQGSPASGGTRTLREMILQARIHEVPVLLLAGRDGAPDPNSPLAAIRTSFNALAGRSVASGSRQARLSRRGRAERTWSSERAIERFLSEALSAAAHTPFVLAVEDYGELPDLARQALSVLARELLSRHEHGSTVAPPPVLLVLDMGACPSNGLLLADVKDPQRPICPLRALSTEEIADIATSRFPGLRLSAAEAEALHAACEGAPATLVALMAEAVRRDDLRSTDGTWAWDLSQLSRYTVRRRLPPIHENALNEADEDLKALLAYLALVDRNLDRRVARTLWSSRSSARFPQSALITVLHHAGRDVLALASHAVRDAVLDGMTDETRSARTTELLTALSQSPTREHALDLTRLLIDTGDSQHALDELTKHAASLSAQERIRIQEQLRRICELDSSVLGSAANRRGLAALLERGPEAVKCAELLAAQIPNDGTELEVVIRVVEVLEETGAASAQGLFERHAEAGSPPTPELAMLQLMRVRAELDRRQLARARDRFADAVRTLRRLGPVGRSSSAVGTLYYGTKGRLKANSRNKEAAVSLLRRALTIARADRDLPALAKLHNNLGIALREANQPADSRIHLSRALRIKRALGDVRGVVSATFNLARAARLQGELLQATSLSYDCVDRAQRYGLTTTLVKTLRELSRVLDQQHRPDLALVTLERAWRAARARGQADGAAAAAWELAPLAASLGRMELASALLHTTAVQAHSTPRGSADAKVDYLARGMHHLTAAAVAMHAGQVDRFLCSVRRAARHANSISVGSQNYLSVLCTMDPEWPTRPELRRLVQAFTRPHRESADRTLYRMHLTLRRLASSAASPVRSSRPAPRVARHVAPKENARAGAEVLLAMARMGTAPLDASLLAGLEASMAMKSLPLIRARVLAARSRSGEGSEQDRAQRFSQAVSLLETTRASTYRAHEALPVELTEATRYLNEALHLPMDTPPRMRELHAVAHKVLLQHGATATPDQRLAAALRKVLEVSARMRGGGSLSSLLHTVTHYALDITGAQRACVVLISESGELVIRASTEGATPDGQLTLRDLSTTVIERAVSTRKALFWHDVFEDPELMKSTSLRALSLRSALCAPLMRGEELYGVMYADTTSAAAAFDAVDLEVLRLFADQAAAAIESSKLVEDVQRSLTELKAVQDRLVKGERLRVMGELSSGVAHEFNNLLTAILARIQMMGLSYLPSEAKRDLDLIEKAALDAAEVVRRLQSFSRQQRQADFKTLDVSDVCQDALELLRPLWRRRRGSDGSALDVELHAESGLFVRGDGTELREVLTNLVKNAIEAVGDGGRIRVFAARRRGRIQVRVEDDGPGIPEDVRLRVFDPFFTTKGERGTGLGLCLSQQIVEKHSGEISVESRIGHGTTIQFYLPAVERSSLRQAAAATESTRTQPALKVVLVDDDADVLAPLQRYLEDCGFDVFTAADGIEGLRLAAATQPHVVLTDIGMPGMDGLEMCRQLHQLQPRTPVVLMSGWASDVDREQARVNGAAEVVSKPFSVHKMRDLLLRVAKQP